MTHKEFKSELIGNRSAVKDAINNVYDNKKIYKNFMQVFDEIDYDDFSAMTKEKQLKLIRSVFGNPEDTFDSLIQKELKKAEKLAAERIKTHEKEDA